MAIINNITQVLQDEIRTNMQSLKWLYPECLDIFEIYWNTDANTIIGDVTNTTDPVTVTTNKIITVYVA